MNVQPGSDFEIGSGGRILRLRKRKLQLLAPVLMRRRNEEAKAGAFAYGAKFPICNSY